MAIIGYARVSTKLQNLDLQIDALNDVGAIRIFTDTASGATGGRTGLTAATDYMRAGDQFAVWRIDRLGRSSSDIVRFVNDLAEREIGLVSLSEGIDSESEAGRTAIRLVAAIAQVEHEAIVSRTMAGLASARKRGRIGGRPPALTAEQITVVNGLYADGRSVREILAITKYAVSRSAIYRALQPTGSYPSRPDSRTN